VKLFSAQKSETTKPLQFLELMKATFNCGGNTRLQTASVRRHEIYSLELRNDDFLKLMMMQFSCFFQDMQA
jgi:hypothetical protein